MQSVEKQSITEAMRKTRLIKTATLGILDNLHSRLDCGGECSYCVGLDMDILMEEFTNLEFLLAKLRGPQEEGDTEGGCPFWEPKDE